MASEKEDKTQPHQKKYTIDELISASNGFGRYQICITMLYIYIGNVTVNNNLFMTFGGIEPKFTCNSPAFSNEAQLPSKNCSAFYNCSPLNRTYSYEFYSIIPQWDLFCDNSYYVQLTSTLQLVGVMIGVLITGHLNDMYGRKWTLLIVMTLEIIVGALSALSTSWQMFLAFRFAIGLTIGGDVVSAWVWACETTTNKGRFLMVALSELSIIRFGDVALLSWLTQHWKWYSLVSNLHGIPCILLIAFSLESPRWLAQKGRTEEAKAVLRKIAAFNGYADQIPQHFELDLGGGNESSRSRKFTFVDLFRTKRSTLYTLVSCLLWFSVTMIYYGMLLDLGNLGNIYVGILIRAATGLVEIPVALLDFYLPKLNRKIVLLGSLAVALSSNIAVGLCIWYGLETAARYAWGPTLVTVVSVLGNDSDNIAFDTAYVFSAELFPTLIRSIANSFSSMAGRIGGLLAPQIIFLKEFWTPLPYFTFAAIGVVAWVTVFFTIPNTKNKTLPESIYDEVREESSTISSRSRTSSFGTFDSDTKF